jgi:predicted secreted protein
VKKLIFILIPAALLLFSCQQTPTPVATADLGGITDPRIMTAVAQTLVARPTASAAELVVTDPAKPIEVSAGSEFHITVANTLSEDYHWELADAVDPSLVQYVWKDEAPRDPKDPNSISKDIWRFKALAPGKTTIKFGYYQGMTVNAAQTPVFTVVVK